jgi:hypothetical protein
MVWHQNDWTNQPDVTAPPTVLWQGGNIGVHHMALDPPGAATPLQPGSQGVMRAVIGANRSGSTMEKGQTTGEMVLRGGPGSSF